MSNNCLTCPSRLNSLDASRFFGKAIDAPMCARFGHVLGVPGKDGDEKIGEFFGQSCPDHGKPKPPAATNLKTQVVTGDPMIMINGLSSDAEKQQVNSCSGCKHFVSEDAVQRELGWTTGLCSMSGRLIIGSFSQMRAEAQRCDYRSPGANRATTEGLRLLAQYDGFDSTTHDPIKAFVQGDGPLWTEPSEYETDLPVSPDDAALGIRAWRKVMDPAGSGSFTHLPIYNLDHFTEEMQAQVPKTGDEEHPELYVDHAGLVYSLAVAWMELDETPMLWGEPGSGKTEAYRHMAWLMQVPFHRISITESTEVDDLIGKMAVVMEETAEIPGRHEASMQAVTKFQLGRLPKVWAQPGVLCLDEPNAGPPAVWQAIRPLTDNSKQLVLDQDKGQKVERNTDCFFGMAANPAWDVRNSGVMNLADADGSRLMHSWCPLPPENVEKHILRERCKLDGYEIPEDKLDIVMKIAQDIRELSEQGTIPITWGIRHQIKVARASRWFDWKTVYKRAGTDGLEPQTQDTILTFVSTHTDF